MSQNHDQAYNELPNIDLREVYDSAKTLHERLRSDTTHEKGDLIDAVDFASVATLAEYHQHVVKQCLNAGDLLSLAPIRATTRRGSTSQCE